MNNQRSKQTKKQVSIEAILYQIKKVSTSMNIVVLRYIGIVVLNCCRTVVWKCCFISTNNQGCE